MNLECAPQRMEGGYYGFPSHKWISGPDAVGQTSFSGDHIYNHFLTLVRR